MNRVTLYTTEPCGFCRTAKALLQSRRVPYEEINLSKDPAGRAELAQRTGMMTFPQVMIDGEPIGGFQELVRADRAGLLHALAAASPQPSMVTTAPSPTSVLVAAVATVIIPPPALADAIP